MSEETLFTAARRVVRFLRGDDHAHGGLLSRDTIQANEILAIQVEREERRTQRRQEEIKIKPAAERVGDWMQTYTGRMFWPLDPRPEEIDIEDIAHALSLQCRFAGHCNRFYSVAEHSVLMSKKVAPEHALWALMHDAAEAYCTDIVRPLKRSLIGYLEIEARIMTAICQKFNLSPVMPTEVKQADNQILNDERDQNMKPPPADWGLAQIGAKDPLGVQLEFWSPVHAEAHFLGRAHFLLRQ